MSQCDRSQPVGADHNYRLQPIVRVTPPGLQRGECAACTSHYRANIETELLMASIEASGPPLHTIDWLLDRRYEVFHEGHAAP